jgi:hypothetical protein
MQRQIKLFDQVKKEYLTAVRKYNRELSRWWYSGGSAGEQPSADTRDVSTQGKEGRGSTFPFLLVNGSTERFRNSYRIVTE